MTCLLREHWAYRGKVTTGGGRLESANHPREAPGRESAGGAAALLPLSPHNAVGAALTQNRERPVEKQKTKPRPAESPLTLA